MVYVKATLASLHRVILSSCGLIGLSLLLVASQVTQADASTTTAPFEALPPDVVIETVVPNANQLVAMAFTPDGRLLYTERTGNVRVVVNGQLSPVPVNTFTSVINTEGERGLLGIAVDPDFEINHYVWTYYTRRTSINPPQFSNRIVRFVLSDDNAGLNTVKAHSYPVDRYVTIHNGGNLHFGPDGKLYVTVGNNANDNDPGTPSQNLGSELGKILRYNPTVPLSTPGDNPWPGSSIYAYGLRNSFDFDFDPISGAIFATDNGSDCDDELNRILPAHNYGWRVPYPCDDALGPDPAYNTIPPLAYWTPSIAPTGVAFYTGDLIPEWYGDAFMCNWKEATANLQHIRLNPARSAIQALTVLSDTVKHQTIRCQTDVVVGPEGALYYSEGGGWTTGAIKRLTRRTSFLDSHVDSLMPYVQTGDTLEMQITLQHRGTLSNTFNVSVDPLGQAAIIGAQTDRGTLNFSATNLTWTGSVSGTEAVTATYTLQTSTIMTDTYWLSNLVNITAPQATPVTLSPQVVVNGYAVYLPIARR